MYSYGLESFIRCATWATSLLRWWADCASRVVCTPNHDGYLRRVALRQEIALRQGTVKSGKWSAAQIIISLVPSYMDSTEGWAYWNSDDQYAFAR